MQTALIAAVLLGCQPGNPAVDEAALAQAAATLAPRLQTGTLIASQGDCLAVKAYTASAYTHVAIVIVADGRPQVYDAMNGAGVRRTPLPEFLRLMSPDTVQLFHPRRSLTAEQGGRLRDYLDGQLGRPYGIAHFLTGERADGIHCAEYATDALASIDLVRAARPAKVSPASLIAGVTRHNVYAPADTIRLMKPVPDPPAESDWCDRMWFQTKDCTRRFCRKLSAWMLCR